MIMAIDPGVTTGYAILSDKGFLEVGEIPIKRIRSGLRTLSQRYPDATVVSEVIITPYLSDIGKDLHRVQQAIFEAFGQAPFQVKPGVWKNSSVTQIKLDEDFSQHQQDACYIALYTKETYG